MRDQGMRGIVDEVFLRELQAAEKL